MRIKIVIFFFLLFSLSCYSKTKNNQEQTKDTTIELTDELPKILSGKIIKIHDGDTYNLLIEENKTIRIRMDGIDAPEGGMPYYRVSKNYLSDLGFGQQVKIQIKEKDDFGRYIATTHLSDGRELSQEMIKAGLAWHYKAYDSDNTLAKMELEARKDKRGLWQEKDPVPPWIIRRVRRQRISTKGLAVFRERTFNLSLKKDEFREGNLRIQSKRKGLELDIYKDDALVQTIREANKTGKGKIKSVSVADYNMDGNPDLLFLFENDFSYYLFNPSTNTFQLNKDWKVRIWKMDKPKHEFLASPEGTVYSGVVEYYKVEKDIPELMRRVKYYKN